MCGIIGAFNVKNHKEIVKKGMKIISYRGRDSKNIISAKEYSIGHLLHSIVGFVKQPIKFEDSILIANCEIYNYEKLSKEYGLDARNDADLIIKLVKKAGLKKALKLMDGVYAFAYIEGSKVYLARDLIGEKPIWYSAKPFSFASEKKALDNQGIKKVIELNPRLLLTYDINTKELNFEKRDFFEIEKPYTEDDSWIIKKTEELLVEAVKKRVPEKVKLGLLFSGGVDSTIIAIILKKLGVKFTCYSGGVKGSSDLEWSKKIAKKYNLKLKIAYFNEKKVESVLKPLCNLLESSNVVKLGVAIPFYYSCRLAHKDNVKVILSGLGSEELFAGYQRFEGSADFNEEGRFGLLSLYERDLYRDDVITMYNNIELRLPFLDLNLVKHSLKIPNHLKVNNGMNKVVLRIVGKNLGLDELYANRLKKAAQYGSLSDKLILKLSKNHSSKSAYIRSLYDKPIMNVGVLYSSGKDSNLALYIMKQLNYNVSCLITMINKEEYSYMFHKPDERVVALQGEALGIPVFFGATKGEKELELNDLFDTVKNARDKYELEGIVTGALFSNYQRGRIVNVCEKLGLKVFSPMWHENQEGELRELIRDGFKFVLVNVAALGLDKTWLNKMITMSDVDKLKDLEKKYGLNIAGEGGEYESLVLDGPIFRKKLVIDDVEIVEENENTAHVKIKKAHLEEKKVFF
ncbi:Amidophosphoribosyltransferase [Candidatus Tiddalikarchaeum anstoanum]|nr:Amidophosphoribosyltransferase [Candidatus Tiddalikarchaeum anstoanum]